jgi:hypothetical protein
MIYMKLKKPVGQLKKQTLLFVCLCCGMFFLSSNVYSNLHRLDFSTNDDEEAIALQGSFYNNPVKSASMYPIEVTKSSDWVTVSYLVNLNNINVTVTDGSGQLVYNNNVNPVSGGQLLINISNWTQGAYTITFTNAAGGYVYGMFEIENEDGDIN